MNSHNPHSPSVDPDEVQRFSNLARRWWDPVGPFRPLHRFNIARVALIANEIAQSFQRNLDNPHPLKNLSVIDIGCGGGLACEPLARLGADVVGVDASSKNVAVAQSHARDMNLNIKYHSHSPEQHLLSNPNPYDVALALEVVEHVADLNSFIQSASKLLKPNGLLFLATINRTFKAYALAVVAAERILRWLPKGSHQWSKFVTPDEARSFCSSHNLLTAKTLGLSYHPLYDEWRPSSSLAVNYMLVARKLAEPADPAEPDNNPDNSPKSSSR